MAATTMLIAAYIFYVIVVGKVALSRNFPALIVFGDSIVDSGNNNYLQTIAKGNFPPYGRDFQGGKSTGRFSNGKVPSDLFAEALGIKQFIPPYLDPTLQINDLLTGVCFASGAAGYDPLSAQLANVLSLTDQLKLFEEYKGKLRAAVGENRTEFIISESIYLIACGSNDLTNTFYGPTIRRTQYNINSYTDFMVGYASSFFQDLYKAGAKEVAILSAPPCGCLPSQRTLAGGSQRECVQEYNNAAMLYNSKLKSAILSLNNSLPGATLLYLDIYTPLLDLINNPTKEGFEISNRGCCGTGEIEAALLCSRYAPGTCPDASIYLFFDAYHPTQHGYEVLVRRLLEENYKYIS